MLLFTLKASNNNKWITSPISEFAVSIEITNRDEFELGNNVKNYKIIALMWRAIALASITALVILLGEYINVSQNIFLIAVCASVSSTIYFFGVFLKALFFQNY